MNKDVIYIDTDDDITAIIGKIKNSKDKIIALVPPKRIGVLQSTVNLRLLSKMAEKSQKRLVLVTNNKALINLATVAKIPVAKSLQSKPELAEIDVLDIDDGEDVIDGEKLPVGDLMKTADEPMEINIINPKKENVNDIIDKLDVEKQDPISADKGIETITLPSKKIKVPDFVKFRKILFLSIFILIGLGGFLYWAIKEAPSAQIIIKARTEKESVGAMIKLGAETNIEKNTIKAVTKEIKKDLSVTFDATGQKDVGKLATGIITITNCDDTRPFTIDSGTIFTTGSELSFASISSVVVPGYSGKATECQSTGVGAGKVDVAVTAIAPGESYNIAKASFEISSISGYVYANSDGMTGGTTEIANVVTAKDIEKATDSLKALSTDSVKQQLIKQFEEDELVLPDSYTVAYGDPVSSPAVDEVVTTKAVLKSSTTFKMSGISKSEVATYLDDAFSKKINEKSEKVFDNGIDGVKLSGYLSNAEGATVKITASGEIGPNLNEDKVVDLIKGKKFGDAQQAILGMPGVSDIEINFSYFWVKSVPSDVKKIDVQFIIDDAKGN